MRFAACFAGVAVAVLAVTGCTSSPAPVDPTSPASSSSATSDAAEVAYVTEFAQATYAVFEAANATALAEFDQSTKMSAVEIAVESQTALQAAQTWLESVGAPYTPPTPEVIKFKDAETAKQAEVAALEAWGQVASQPVPTGDAVMDQVVSSAAAAAEAYIKVLTQQPLP